MIAEVYFKEEFVCLVTQEDGLESADIGKFEPEASLSRGDLAIALVNVLGL